MLKLLFKTKLVLKYHNIKYFSLKMDSNTQDVKSTHYKYI